MLNALSIKNVAVIDKLEVNLKNGVSVLTGETGAGKSIIIDSINMILGSRASKELVRFGTDKAVVQAVFEAGKDVCGILEENDVDCEDGQIIITRQISKDGKSIAKINGSIVTLSLLREIADKLINIHGQHDNQALLTPHKHILFLDSYACDTDILNEYKRIYHETVSVKKQLSSLKMDEQEKMQRIDLLKYQVEEIEKAELKPGEDDELFEQREICENAEKISVSIEEAYVNLYQNEEMQSAYDSLSIAVSALEDIYDINDTIKNAYESISNAMYAVEDAAHELKDFSESVDFDEESLDYIEERLDLILKLKRKYGNTIEEILKHKEHSQKELEKIMLSDEKTEELSDKLKKCMTELKKAGKKLSDARKKAALELEGKIEQALGELNMEKSKFKVMTEPLSEFRENGIDRVEFMISTNPGEPLKPLVKIASGGELSRVMLAIKSILAASDDVDTLIFDEIDTGVSGKTAMKIAVKLSEIGRDKQVICITHLPQLTAMADNHYLINKNTDGELASTTLKELDSTGRELELARIIDGNDVTDLAVEHARQMLKKTGRKA